MDNKNRIRIAFLLSLLGIVTVLSFFVLKPFLAAIFLAIVFAVVFNGFFDWSVRLFRGNRTFAALFSTVIVCLGILIPVIVFGALIFQETQALYQKLPTGNEGGIVESAISAVKGQADKIFPSLSGEVVSYVRRIVEWLMQNLDSFFAGLFNGILSFFIMMLGLFFFFRDGKRILSSLIDLSPLQDTYDRRIFEKVKVSTNAIVRGYLIISVVQGLLTFFGFLFFGVPNPALWGAVAVIASIIPSIGTSLVTVPAIVYLFLTDASMIQVLGLVIWAAVAVGLVDNILTPFLIKKGGTNIHPFLILVSVLGGITFFGPVGFIAGPVVLSMFFALLDVYPMVVRGIDQEQAAIDQQ